MNAGDACQLEEAASINSQFYSSSITFAQWFFDLEKTEDLSLANKPDSYFQDTHQERAMKNCCKIVFEKGLSIFI